MTSIETGVCVVGGGPAGSVFAARLAALGHRVTLVERCASARRHVGESLTPGVLLLLDATGARRRVEQAGFLRAASVQVKWGGKLIERSDPEARGLLVDRGHFDTLLLDQARAAGVQVLQPMQFRGCRESSEGWTIDVDGGAEPKRIQARFLADASGRSFATRGVKRRTGAPAIAFYAYWQGEKLPGSPRVEAGADAWFWGVPLPGGLYNTLVFCDPRTHHPREFGSLLAQSALLAGSRGIHPASPVLACDATPYLDAESVTPSSIKIGDAALSLDPLSSSGVQKAIQSALSGAIVVNTVLRKPELANAAMAYYRSMLKDAAARHSRWAGEYYAQAAAVHGGAFWQRRAQPFAEPAATSVPERPRSPGDLTNARLAVSPDATFSESPCLDGDFVSLKTVVAHPALERPVAFVGGWDMPPLLRQLPAAGLKPIEIARLWSASVPFETALSLTGWLAARGVLAPVP